MGSRSKIDLVELGNVDLFDTSSHKLTPQSLEEVPLNLIFDELLLFLMEISFLTMKTVLETEIC